MCLTYLLHIELHIHNLKQFDEAWEEMLLSLDKNMLEKLDERQLKKSQRSRRTRCRCIIRMFLSKRNRRATKDCESSSIIFSKVDDKIS